LPRQLDMPDSTSTRPNRASSTEIKEKMEQQLKQQREAHNKKRADEQKCKIIKIPKHLHSAFNIHFHCLQLNHNTRHSLERYLCEMPMELRK
jgi:hypothetical protein